MKRVIAILFLLVSTANAGWKPASFQGWVDEADSTKRRVQLGGEIQNYKRHDGVWDSIRINWTGTGPWHDTLGLFKVSVNDTALSTVTIRHDTSTLTLTQQPVRLMWLKVSTGATQNLFTTRTFTNTSRDSNILKWTNLFPAVDYYIQVTRNGVAHAISYKKAFLDSAVTLYNQRADSLDIALCNLIKYTASGVDLGDSAIGTVTKRRLKQIGQMAFDVDSQNVHWGGGDTAKNPPVVYQKWVRISGALYCAEYVMMSDLKKLHVAMPSVPLWHNTLVTIGAGTNDLDGTYIYNQTPTSNYGTGSAIWVNYDSYNPDFIYTLLYSSTLKDSISGRTVDACSLLVKASGAVGKTYLKGIKRSWTESQATWNIAKTGTNWGTAGCENTTSDLYGSGAKQDSITNAGDSIAAPGGWFPFNITAYIQASDNSDTANYQGFRLETPNDGGSYYFHSDDATTSGNRPKIYLYYTGGGGPGPRVSNDARIRRMANTIRNNHK